MKGLQWTIKLTESFKYVLIRFMLPLDPRADHIQVDFSVPPERQPEGLRREAVIMLGFQGTSNAALDVKNDLIEILVVSEGPRIISAYPRLEC